MCFLWVLLSQHHTQLIRDALRTRLLFCSIVMCWGETAGSYLPSQFKYLSQGFEHVGSNKDARKSVV